MAFLLHIETSTTMCSVSVSNNSELLAIKEVNEGYSHAENLHLFIEAVVYEAKVELTELSAVVVSKGPGSYTGLRIGVSAAKGIAYALNIPLISIDTLEIMTIQAKHLCKDKTYFCPMLDAKRMEVYSRIYNYELEPQNETQAIIITEKSILLFREYTKIVFFGEGALKCKPILSALAQATFLEEIVPSARFMPNLVYKKFLNNDFEDTAYFEPFYLKDFLILNKKTY